MTCQQAYYPQKRKTVKRYDKKINKQTRAKEKERKKERKNEDDDDDEEGRRKKESTPARVEYTRFYIHVYISASCYNHECSPTYFSRRRA